MFSAPFVLHGMKAAQRHADGECERLRAADARVDVDGGQRTAVGGRLELDVDLPMPAVVRVRLRPVAGADVTGPTDR